MTRIIALSNQKGGVGKTTTTVNLSTALAACGHKVLVVDFDPQGNTTTAFGVDKFDCDRSVYDVMVNESPVMECKVATSIPGLDVLPSTIHLSGAEVEMVSMISRESRLKQALDAVMDEYDFIFIDCPPSLGLLTVNALVAAKEVMVPMQCEFYAMEGLTQLLQTISIVRKQLNPELQILGVLMTMYDKRNRLSQQVMEDVRAHLGAQVMRTVIPRNVRLSEAPSHGRPGLLYDRNCAGSQAYIGLAAEVMKKDMASKELAA